MVDVHKRLDFLNNSRGKITEHSSNITSLFKLYGTCLLFYTSMAWCVCVTLLVALGSSFFAT